MRRSALLWIIAGIACAIHPAARAQDTGADKPAKTQRRATATHHWHAAGGARPLWHDPSLRADFTPAPVGKSAVLRPSNGPLKDVSAAMQSPVFRDEGGRPRALPGGVVVVLDAALDDAAARALLAAHRAPPARRVGERIWLVESPAGIESLDLANRLAATGAFAAAEPNWWVERVRK